MIPINEIASRYGREQAATILICRIYLGAASYTHLDEFIVEYAPDWVEVSKVIEANKLRPIAFQVLAKANVPKEMLKNLKQFATMNAVKSMMSMNEVASISNKLADIGVDVLPYKGVVFSAAYYDNYSSREFSDIDFLILLKDGNELEVAKQMFDEEGYEAMHDNPSAIKDVLIENTCEFYFNKYENGDRKFHADFHWLAHHPVFDLPSVLGNELLFKNATTTTLSGRKIKSLNDNNHFITVMLHHGVREGCKTLKYVLDFAQIIKRGELDWDYLYGVSDKHKYSNVQSACLQITEELLGVKADTANCTRQNTDSYKELLFLEKPRNRSLIKKQLSKLKWVDDSAGKLKMIGKTIMYSFQPSVLDYKFLRLPKPLYFLYVFVKLIRVGLSPFRKEKN